MKAYVREKKSIKYITVGKNNSSVIPTVAEQTIYTVYIDKHFKECWPCSPLAFYRRDLHIQNIQLCRIDRQVAGQTGNLHIVRQACSNHCNEIPFLYSIPFLGIAPPQSQLIHVSVSDLYISRIRSHIFLQQNRQIDNGSI
jgi:hypothetical protein